MMKNYNKYIKLWATISCKWNIRWNL